MVFGAVGLVTMEMACELLPTNDRIEVEVEEVERLFYVIEGAV